MNSFDELVNKTVNEYKSDPRNKVFVDENLLLLSVREETGNAVSAEILRGIIRSYQGGGLDTKGESIYDGAVYVCGRVARMCFSEDPDIEDLDYEISWIENDDGSFTAEVRPN